jgi:hypothetical protein
METKSALITGKPPESGGRDPGTARARLSRPLGLGGEAPAWSDIVASPRKVVPWLAMLTTFPALGLIAVFAYGLAVDGTAVIAVGFMVAGGAFIVGALLGFLFGVPRALTSAGQESGLRSNTNLEQISDWLTKILVGVGLVEIGQLADSGSRLVSFLAPALGGGATSEAFAAGMLVFFTTTGFLISYVITRAVVGPLFSQTEYVIQHVVGPASTDDLSATQQPNGDSTNQVSDPASAR